VAYHSTDVVTIHPDGTFTLDTGGWDTQTTKERMTTYSPAKIWQKAGILYLSHGPDSGGTFEPLFDGARLDARGNLLNPRAPARRLGFRPAGSEARVKGLLIKDVAKAWGEGRPGTSKSGDYRTDGESLWSYDLVIGQTIGGRKTLWDFTAAKGRPGVSPSTSQHVWLARSHAAEVLDPRGEIRLGRVLRPPALAPPRDALREATPWREGPRAMARWRAGR
jgi:hypothetical protein